MCFGKNDFFMIPHPRRKDLDGTDFQLVKKLLVVLLGYDHTDYLTDREQKALKALRIGKKFRGVQPCIYLHKHHVVSEFKQRGGTALRYNAFKERCLQHHHKERRDTGGTFDVLLTRKQLEDHFRAQIASREQAEASASAGATPEQHNAQTARLNDCLRQLAKLRAQNEKLKLENTNLRAAGQQPCITPDNLTDGDDGTAWKFTGIFRSGFNGGSLGAFYDHLNVDGYWDSLVFSKATENCRIDPHPAREHPPKRQCLGGAGCSEPATGD